MGTTRLEVWNGSLLLLGETKLATETETREARYVCEDNYERAVQFVLERAYWNFALKRAEVTGTTANAATGFTYGYAKPADWVKTFLLSENLESTHPAPMRYADEGGFWQTDVATFQIVYVSSDIGTDETIWPSSFQFAVEAELAFRMAPKLAAARVDEFKKLSKDALRDAKSQDALDEGVKSAPEGRWVRARRGTSNRDGGSRSTLIG
jgi:hypothetical protein